MFANFSPHGSSATAAWRQTRSGLGKMQVSRCHDKKPAKHRGYSDVGLSVEKSEIFGSSHNRKAGHGEHATANGVRLHQLLRHPQLTQPTESTKRHSRGLENFGSRAGLGCGAEDLGFRA